MLSEKKLSMEDTWKTGDLEKHMRRGVYDEDNVRRKDRRRTDEEGKKDRSANSERRHRDHEREAPRDRDRHRERERTKPRDPDRDKDLDRRREGTRDRTANGDERNRERRREQESVGERDRERRRERESTGERDRERRREQESTGERDRERRREQESAGERERERTRAQDGPGERERERRRERQSVGDRDRERRRERESAGETDRARDSSKPRDRDQESRDRRHERVEKESRDGERERRRAERDRERGTERERKREQGRDGDREGDKGRTRERERDREKERDGEHDYERRKEKERHRERGYESKRVKETEGYKDELQEKHLESKREHERRERHGEREHSRRKEDKEYPEQRGKEKEERERRRREREEHSQESRTLQEEPREEERERRRRERRQEAQRRLADDTDGRDRRSHDQPEARRPTEERDGESALALAHSGGEKARKEPKETKVEKEEVEVEKASGEGQEDGDGADYYEEDFEDYEDDFEEADESDGEEDDDGEKSEDGNKEEELSPQKRREIEEIRRAMKAENERVGSSQQRPAGEAEISKRNFEVPQSKRTQHGKFIDFVAAKHREVGKKLASKQKKRSTELLRLIDLDFSVTFPLLDLPPVNEYDMYIKSFGTTNTKQAYVQCNEDNTDRDIQTEEIEADEKWTQHPGDGGAVCGGPKLTSEASGESMAKMNIDSKRLAEFLLSASQVAAVLLEEDRAERRSLRRPESQAHALSCSDGCLQLNTNLPFLHGREVSLLSFSPVQRQTLLSVHGPTTKPSAVRLDSKTILCIWNIWEPSSPRKVLVYESEVLCCCFGPGTAPLVFAGTAVGSVVLWDLREQCSLHQTLTIGDQDWTLRYPTFSTDAVLSPLGHSSSVRSVEPVPVAMVTEGVRSERSLLPSHQGSSGLSFQLASLDDSGVMNLWVVVELQKVDQAGSQTDLGLKPGGKVKLLHSSTLITNERSSQREALKTGPPHTLLLKFLPSDSNHFFIGTDMGLVTHGTRHGLKITPKFYWPQDEGPRPVHITAVDVSPFGEPLFLVGSADGSIRVHSVGSGQPLMEWSGSTRGEPVLSVQWALTRPAVFCVLDGASHLHLWDLLEKDYEPVTTQRLRSDGVTAMAVFGDPAKPSTLSGVCLANQSGEIEIQFFNKKWAVPTNADLVTLHNILNEAF